MILRLLEENYPLDEIIYFDIGVEFPAIKNNAERLKELLRNGKREITLTILEPDKPFMWYMLEKDVHKKNGTEQKGYKWCGGMCRWGTQLKLQAIHENNKKYGDEVVVEYIGIASDERERMEHHRIKRQSKRIQIFPLVEWGMTEKDCLKYCYEKGWNWDCNGVDLYSILDRVSCWCCGNKNLKELRNIYHFLPEVWEQLKDLQRKIEIPFKQNASIFELEKRFKKEDSEMLFDYKDLSLQPTYRV